MLQRRNPLILTAQKAIIKLYRNGNVGYTAIFIFLLRTKSNFGLQVAENVSFLRTVAIVMAANSFKLGVKYSFSIGYHISNQELSI